MLNARHEVHCAAHAFDTFAGDHPVCQVTVVGYLHGSEDGEVDVAAADHRERVRTREGGGSGEESHGFLAGVDQIGVDFGFQGEGAHAEESVLRLQDHGHIFGNIVGNEGGHADAEVDVEAVAQFG